MSTPTTALPQPLPHYSGARHNGYHHQHYSANPASFHAPYSVVAAPPSRLSLQSPSAHSLSAYSPSSSHSGVLGINHSLTSARPPLQDTTTTLPPLAHNTKHAMPIAQPQQPSRPQPPTGHKRKRGEPDWNAFYKNGLPEEIIVIDDTPEPQGPPSVSSQALTNGDTSASETRHAAKRQKRINEPAHYDPVYHNIASSHTHTSRQLASPSKSTVSSDRTNSALHTTAATSLGSSSSNGTYDHDAQIGQKRRRTTRQQIANEAKRQEELKKDLYPVYQPPPYPPKKAAEVPVRVIADVSPLVLGDHMLC